jgi:hypothetical protein
LAPVPGFDEQNAADDQDGAGDQQAIEPRVQQEHPGDVRHQRDGERPTGDPADARGLGETQESPPADRSAQGEEKGEEHRL